MQTIHRHAFRPLVTVAVLLLAGLNLQAQPQQGQGAEPTTPRLTCDELRLLAIQRSLTEEEKRKLVTCRLLGDVTPSSGDHSTNIKPPTW